MSLETLTEKLDTLGVQLQKVSNSIMRIRHFFP